MGRRIRIPAPSFTRNASRISLRFSFHTRVAGKPIASNSTSDSLAPASACQTSNPLRAPPPFSPGACAAQGRLLRRDGRGALGGRSRAGRAQRGRWRRRQGRGDARAAASPCRTATATAGVAVAAPPSGRSRPNSAAWPTASTCASTWSGCSASTRVARAAAAASSSRGKSGPTAPRWAFRGLGRAGEAGTRAGPQASRLLCRPQSCC